MTNLTLLTLNILVYLPLHEACQIEWPQVHNDQVRSSILIVSKSNVCLQHIRWPTRPIIMSIGLDVYGINPYIWNFVQWTFFDLNILSLLVLSLYPFNISVLYSRSMMIFYFCVWCIYKLHEWVSYCCLQPIKSSISQLYYGENILILNKMMMRSALF
jgi:hypothetical protein